MSLDVTLGVDSLFFIVTDPLPFLGDGIVVFDFDGPFLFDFDGPFPFDFCFFGRAFCPFFTEALPLLDRLLLFVVFMTLFAGFVIFLGGSPLSSPFFLLLLLGLMDPFNANKDVFEIWLMGSFCV